MAETIDLSGVFNYNGDGSTVYCSRYECVIAEVSNENLLKRLNGKRKRPDYYVSEIWTNDYGELGRSYGPAIKLINPYNGIAVIERYFSGGKLHRRFGPAIIERDTYSGEVTKQEFYRKGRLVVPNYGPEKWSPF
jgi:hypothetical protein